MSAYGEAVREIERLKRALDIARRCGEHYPTCDPAPREVMRLGSPEWKKWREEHRPAGGARPFCDCWIARMERAVRGED